MSSDDLSRFCCQNRTCELHGVRDEGNLSVYDLVGKHGNIRLLRCRSCQARFSEYKGTPFYQSKLPHETVIAILEHLDEGVGTRQTARLCRVHRDTVTRLALLAGKHARDTHDESVELSPPNPRSPARREVGVRGQETGPMRPDRPR